MVPEENVTGGVGVEKDISPTTLPLSLSLSLSLSVFGTLGNRGVIPIGASSSLGTRGVSRKEPRIPEGEEARESARVELQFGEYAVASLLS